MSSDNPETSATAKQEVIKGVKVPRFEGDKKKYEHWRGLVDDWIFEWASSWPNPGITIRGALEGEPWRIVKSLTHEEIQGPKGYERVLELLDLKYKKDRENEKWIVMNNFLRIDKKCEENMQDYVSRFDTAYRDCLAVGLEGFNDFWKGGMLINRANLTDINRQVLIGVLGTKTDYDTASKSLIRMFVASNQKQHQEWLAEDSDRKPERRKCFICNKEGHISRFCKKKESVEEIKCQGCFKKGHTKEKCWSKDLVCFKCQKKGHVAPNCPEGGQSERSEENKKTIHYGHYEGRQRVWYNTKEKNSEYNGEHIVGIIDTGCRGTLISDKYLSSIVSNMTDNENRVFEDSSQKSDNSYYFGGSCFQAKRRVDIPVFLGKQKVWITTDVVEEEIPWLIGTGTQKNMGAIIDVKRMEMTLENLEKEKVKIAFDQEGHVKIDLRKIKRDDRCYYSNHTPDWFRKDDEWAKKCKHLHLQFGHAPYEKIKGVVIRAVGRTECFKEVGERRLAVLKTICEDFWRRIEITSRAGKAGGRWKNCYNFVDIDSGEKDWLNLDDNEEMLEINDSEEDLEDEEEFFFEGEIVYFENSKTNMAERVEIAKEKELENWREHQVYEEITKQQLPNDMKPLTTRWV